MVNAPAPGNGYFAVQTEPGAVVYFYPTTNFGVTTQVMTSSAWTLLQGAVAPDGAGVIADASGVAAIQAPWIGVGSFCLGVAYSGRRAGMAICPGGTQSSCPLVTSGWAGMAMARLGRLGFQTIRLR